MMKIDTKSDMPAKPSRTLPKMSTPELKSAATSDSSVALSTTSMSEASAASWDSINGRSAPESTAMRIES